MKARGFTLIEALAAMAIAGVIIASATGAVMNINQLIADTSRKTAAWDEAKRLEEFLIAQAQAAGGGQVRPHHSIFIENASGAVAPNTVGCRTIAGIPDCSASGQGADRLTFFVQDPAFPNCQVTGSAGANLVVGAGASACCLDDGPGGFQNREALLIGPLGAVSVHLFNRTSAGTSSCAINAPPGQGAGLLPTALASAGFPAVLVVAPAQTLFVDRTGQSRNLRSWSDTNGDGTAQPAEIITIHDRVYDMQLAAGYDSQGDGRLSDTNSTTDEFIYNVVSDAPPAGVQTGQLRMMQIALAVGTPSAVSGRNQVRLLNRPAAIFEDGVYLTATSSKAFMRNLALFTQ